MPGRLGTSTVAGDFADHLRRLIHSGHLSAGDRLPAERELATEFGIARVSVREAIKVLQEAGYLTVRRGGQGGTFVAPLDAPYSAWLELMRERAGELDAILDLRVAVESHTAHLAALRRSNADIELLRRTLDPLAGSYTRSSFRLADSQFHVGVAAAAHSPRLEETVITARGEFFLPTDTLIFQEQVEPSLTGHTAVLSAIEAREPELAAAAMINHIEETRSHFHRVLRGQALPTTNRHRFPPDSDLSIP
jgi:GntR family transcriptional repressor for pyruvate dehydrogenase complex